MTVKKKLGPKPKVAFKPLSDHVRTAIKCGMIPVIRDWQNLPVEQLTLGERVLRFAADFLVFPEGIKAGQPLILDEFQQAFILSTFDNPKHVAKAIQSQARRGGKTLVMAVILLAYLIGPLAKQNTLIRSAAMNREQAGLLHRLMALTLAMSPKVEGTYKNIPSMKRIVGLRKNVDYTALAREAKGGHGQAVYALVVDECGQIDAPTDDFLGMLFSSLGTYADSRSFLISTQAPTDSAFFSVEIDSAIRDQPDNVVVHLYEAPNEDVEDEANWYAANPSLYGGYRSIEDIRNSAAEAKRIPAKQASFLNLFLNRRVSLKRLWLAPSIWKENSSAPDMDVFVRNGVSLGLDLSMVNDLTAAVMSAVDENGDIHVKCYAFTPLDGIAERSRVDRVPYEQWAREGVIYAPPGKTLDYDMICQYLKLEVERYGIVVNEIHFDRWRAEVFWAACDRTGFALEAIRHDVGQGYQSMSPRIEAMETALLKNKIRHGNAPVLNMGAAAAIVLPDPAGNRKLTKASSTGPKIDGIIAMLMSVYPHIAQQNVEFDVSAMIG